jgi:hypothetical protein
MRSTNRVQFIAELVICTIFIPPYTDHTLTGMMVGGTYEYSVDMIVTSLMLLKLYTVVRVYEHLSTWLRQKAKIIAQKFQVKVYFLFGFKSDIKFRNVQSVAVAASLVILMFGVVIRNFEKDF